MPPLTVLRSSPARLSLHKEQGHYPPTLADAYAAAGTPPSIDPATGRPIGYRLEQGQPLVWLVGIDGVDDGGQNSYTIDNFTQPQTGLDLIYRFNDLPSSVINR